MFSPEVELEVLVRPLKVLAGLDNVVGRRGRETSTLDRWHRIVDAFKNMRATATAARMIILHNSNPTSGHLKLKR